MEINLEYHKNRYKNVEKFLETSHIELENIQTYFPNIYIPNSHISKWSSIKLKFHLISVINKSINNYIGTIIDPSGYPNIVPFHIKSTPIIEPRTLNNYQKYKSSHWIPGKYLKWRNTIDKINNINNSAYVDTLCSILLSRLREQNLTPHFGLLYGVYTGIIKDYQEDITEEYSMINDEDWFIKSLNKKNFIMKKISPKNKKNIDILGLEKCCLDDFAVDIPESEYILKNYDSDEDSNSKTILIYPEVPVQIVFMEKFEITLDDLIKKSISRVRIPTRYNFIRQIRKNIVINKLKSWFFQICAGLSCANKYINFVHNDLHVQNVMGMKTDKIFLYYKNNNNTYKIPTYGYVMNIIDFGRSTFKINNNQYIGDIFDEDADAGGQYTKTGPIPHPAFDLARLACSFLEDLDDSYWPTKNDLENTDIGHLISSWTYDDTGFSLLDIEGFDLYIRIASHFRKTTPNIVINDKIFNNYIYNHSNSDINDNCLIHL